MLFLALLVGFANATPVRDIADLLGVRENTLHGAGVIVGLNRTGDSTQNPAAVETVVAMITKLGFPIAAEQVKSKNVAMVTVTATMPANPRPGMHLDVQVASIGDARSLEGGSLLFTTMFGPDGKPYASASGSVIIGGYSITNAGESVTRNHPTVGIISGGATVEREVPVSMIYDERTAFEWILREGDFANVVRVAEAVNTALECECAHPSDSRTIKVAVPDDFLGRQVEFVARVDSVDVSVNPPARVVVSERTGAVVMGSGIVVHPVAVTLGGLTIEVKKQKEVSQPNALASGDTTVVDQTEVAVSESSGKIANLRGGTVGEIVNALNEMGVTPREVIVLLQMMKAAGAIDAPIVSM